MVFYIWGYSCGYSCSYKSHTKTIYKYVFNQYRKLKNDQQIDNYSQFIDFYNWLINIAPSLENINKKYWYYRCTRKCAHC